MEKITFTRQELYELKWSVPLIQIAKKYSISDNGLRKKCKKLDIPLPEQGYWQKIKYNKPIKKKKLNPNYSGITQITLNNIEDDDLDSNSPHSQINNLIKSYESLDQSIFKVPDRLIKTEK